MNGFFFRDGRMDEAVDLVKRHHYSGRAPSNIHFVATMHAPGGLFGDYGPAVAAVVFSIPPVRWAESVLELGRLVRIDKQIPLTPLISFSLKALKRRGANLLISYADIAEGHHGGIYQAASWQYDGARRPRMNGVVIRGRFVPFRSASNQWGTSNPKKLSKILGCEVVEHYDEGKHLYWKALGSMGKAKARRLGLRNQPYPKPAALEAAE